MDAFGGSEANPHAGVGLFCTTTGEFALHTFSPHQRNLSKARTSVSTLIIEFSAFALLLCTFRDLIEHSVVEVFCDNQGAIDVAKKGYHAATTMGGMCRLLSSLIVSCNCRVVFSHVASQDNLADQLSRGSRSKFLAAISESGSPIEPSERQCLSPATQSCVELQCDFFTQH